MSLYVDLSPMIASGGHHSEGERFRYEQVDFRRRVAVAANGRILADSQLQITAETTR